MQTADIPKSRKCWCERIWAADLARSAPLPLKWFFSTPAHRSARAHAVFRSLRSVFRSAHAPLTCSGDDLAYLRLPDRGYTSRPTKSLYSRPSQVWSGQDKRQVCLNVTVLISNLCSILSNSTNCITKQGIFTVVGNNVNTRYKPEKFDRKLKLANTQINRPYPESQSRSLHRGLL